ncbi:MAG: glycosyltransferase [Lachnospiraceae bacterium]|nr:glycosyltransferase [Lachnospiraceae bacterium]
MKVLILSANTGTGHNSVAMAVRERFEERGDECVVEDCLRFVSPAVSKIIESGHNVLYKYLQPVNHIGWELCANNRSAINEDHPMYKLVMQGCTKLAIYLLQEKYDAVVCSHIFAGWMTGAAVKKYNIPVKTGIIETDYMASLGCEFVDVDYHFVPTKEIAETVRGLGVPGEKVIVSGIPVKKEIYDKISISEAKEKLNIMSDKKHVIVMLGSMGGGPMLSITHHLIKTLGNRIYLTIICGSNRKLYRDLKLAYGRKNNVRITKFIKDISLWMDSADAFVTKPGGISVTEAAAKKLPMILINTVGGCENGNLDYFVQKGGALSASNPKNAAEVCSNLLNDDGQRKRMAEALSEIAEQNDTELIVRTFHEKL